MRAGEVTKDARACYCHRGSHSLMPRFSWPPAAGRAVISRVTLAAALTLTLSVRAAERGYPVVTVFPAETHQAGPQNFDIAQDRRGILYFGNLHGLVSYDGAWWRLLKLPDDQLAYAVDADDRGRVALGLVNDLGSLSTRKDGTVVYESLLDKVPENKRDFGDVLAVCASQAGFLFVSDRRLLLWDGGPVRALAETDPINGPTDCLTQGRSILLRGPQGLQRLDLSSMKVAPMGITKRVTMIAALDPNRAIAAVRDVGLFLVEGDAITPFAPEASEWLRGKHPTAGVRLADGRFVITTLQHGLAILAADGSLETIMGADSGLPDSTINDAMVDREGALWLAMEGPIARIDLTAPVTVFDIRRGVRGSAGDVARHAGRLYTATTHGLFVIDAEGRAERVKGEIEGPWRLLPAGDELLVGRSKGLSRIDAAGGVHLIAETEQEVYDLSPSVSNPARVWTAQGDGIGSLVKTAGGWHYEGLLPGAPDDISSVLEHEGTLWAGSVFNGIIRIDNPRTPQQKVARFGRGEMNVYLVGGQPVFVRATGEILALANGRFVRHPTLGHIQAPRGFFIVLEDKRGRVWINSTPPLSFAPQPGGGYAHEGRPLVAVTAADIQTMRVTDDGSVWFASDKGLFRYEASQTAATLTQPPPLIRRVVAGENRVLFAGATTPVDPVRLNHNFRRMRIEFAPVSFRPGVTYQYRLEPVDAAWSDWTAEPFIDYTTLEPGDYTFYLRARGAATSPSGSARWSFSVLPPWYRTTWAWVLWVALAALIVFCVIRLRTGALRRQARRLETKVAEQTAELQSTVKLLEEANVRLEQLSMEDDLTGIANRRSFERALHDEWNRARRRLQPVALILLDLDHFKDLNDRRGHPAGDDCLRRIGAFLAQTVRRSGELVARYGGEEFAILLPGLSASAAITVAESLREGIEQLGVPYGTSSSSRRVTASCGVASMVPSENVTPDSLVAWADRALYAAKHSGRNCVRVADENATGKWLRDASA